MGVQIPNNHNHAHLLLPFLGFLQLSLQLLHSPVLCFPDLPLPPGLLE